MEECREDGNRISNFLICKPCVTQTTASSCHCRFSNHCCLSNMPVQQQRNLIPSTVEMGRPSGPSSLFRRQLYFGRIIIILSAWVLTRSVWSHQQIFEKRTVGPFFTPFPSCPSSSYIAAIGCTGNLLHRPWSSLGLTKNRNRSFLCLMQLKLNV